MCNKLCDVCLLLITGVHCCSCEGKCLPDGQPWSQLQPGKGDLMSCLLNMRSTYSGFAAKHLYRGLWPINPLSYHTVMSQTLLWAWSVMHWPATWIFVLERHGSRDFSELSHIFKWSLLLPLLMLPENFIFPHLFAVHTWTENTMTKYESQ